MDVHRTLGILHGVSTVDESPAQLGYIVPKHLITTVNVQNALNWSIGPPVTVRQAWLRILIAFLNLSVPLDGTGNGLWAHHVFAEIRFPGTALHAEVDPGRDE